MHVARVRAGAVLWMLCVQFFLAEQIVASAWRNPYSFARNYVSDLGAVQCGLHYGLFVCSPMHAWMNASFVLQGLLIMFGALLARRAFAPWLAYTVGLGLLAVSGVGVLLVGLAPEDLNTLLHVSGAVMHFVCGGVAMIVIGVMFVRDGLRSSVWGSISVVLGIAVLVATALLGLHGTAVWSALRWPVGVVERVPAYAIPAWVAAMGFAVLLSELRFRLRTRFSS